jgi:hypothetical protein
MNANDILKVAKIPLTLDEAFSIQSQISMQIFAENKVNEYHNDAQYWRMKIQEELGFNSDEYYKFLHDTTVS